MSIRKTIMIWLNHKDIPAFRITQKNIDYLQNIYGTDYFIESVKDQNQFLNLLPEAHIVMTWYFKKQWYKIAEKLELILNPMTGKEWVEEDQYSGVKIIHGNFPGIIIRESLLGMILYFKNEIDTILKFKKIKKWDKGYFSKIRTLSKQTVLIIGYGTIGKLCAEVLKVFGTNIVGVKRNIAPGKDIFANKIITFRELRQYLPNADHVIVVLPANKNTDNIFTKEYFSIMKSSACFYNFGRGNCYKESDLIWALKNSEIKAAGLDVFNEEPLPDTSELWSLPNVIVTPHSSAVCSEHLEFFFDQIVESKILN
ncbi:MAG TPA: NAD(P)-dependent oxidoreductase [Victivallales bacterium]|nr:NAD(P)-dependent oxidoreductase [Victivallales bacterium]